MKNKLFIAFFMALISGFSDIFGFLSLNHLFTAHITGNIVIITALMITQTSGVLPKIIALPVFLIAVVIVSFFIEIIFKKTNNNRIFKNFLYFEIVLFIMLFFLGITILNHLSIISMKYLLISMIPVIAMGTHNALIKIYLPDMPPCTVMTGNFTQIIIDFTTLVLSIFNKKKFLINKSTITKKTYIFSVVLIGFIIGCFIGGLGYYFIGFYAILLLIIAFLILIIFFPK